MIIKKEERKKKNSFFKFTTFLYFYFFSSLVAVSILVIVIFQSQTFIQKKDKFLEYLSIGGRYEYLYLPIIAFKAVKSNFYELENIDFEIPFENTIILENLRNDSIIKGVLPSADKMPKVKTKIIYDGNEFNADIRLKGDRMIHFADKEKSSYKLELDKNQYIFGIKKFSIQKPRVRNYIHEWIFHELSKKEQLIKLKYKFINLSINGDDKGLYVIEEGFGKELIERNKRRNGPIFGLDEDISENDNDPVFEIYNKKYWQKPENNLLVNVASQKLHDFFKNKLYVEDVFDLDKWAAYFAILDLTANYHGAYLKSVKFYYNPLNGLFEPIPFDGHRLKPNYHKYNLNYDNKILIDMIENSNNTQEVLFTWIKKFFFKDKKLNQKFYKLYTSYLNKISSKKYIDNFLAENLDEIEKINSHIYADYFFYDNSRNYGIGLYYFLISDFKYHAQNIREKLKTKDQAQLLKINEGEYLFKPYYKNYEQLVAERLICSVEDKEIEMKISQDIKNFENTTIKLDKFNTQNLKCNKLILLNKFNNKRKFLKVDHLNSYYSYENFHRKYFQNYKNFFNEDNNNLILKNDTTRINSNVYIPKGYKVVIKPGQKLLLSNKVFIISNSPWQIGGNGKRVVISGESEDLGGGILVSDTDELSVIKNTDFSFLSGYDLKKNFEHIILGSINFHQTNVEIENVRFNDISSEDAINIFRSKFKIKNAKYNNIFSDAIDIDFSEGKIIQTNFVNINNDAIDFSGSKVDIEDAFFENVNDKIISAGEDSRINIYEITGTNSYAGIISKDGSEVYSQNVNFDGVKIPFAAYQKKNEYNFPSLNAKNYKLKNFSAKSVKDKTAKLFIDDEIIVMKPEKIISLMYEKNFSLIE